MKYFCVSLPRKSCFLLTEYKKISTIRVRETDYFLEEIMAKGKEPILEFEQARKKIMNNFGCDGDFFIKPLLDLEWAVRQEEDFSFLSYWTEDGKKIDAVVVKKDGTPMIYAKKEYTMVVAIDCVKIGFVFRNGKKQA